MATIFYEHDANPIALHGKTIAVWAMAARDMPRRKICAIAATT